MPTYSGESPLGADTNTRYLKRVLVPFWVIRCILMVLLVVGDVAALALVHSDNVTGNKGAAIG
jgi:hypothetical protein